MLQPVAVEDPADARLAPYRHLHDPTRRGRVEAARGIFVAEGHLALAQLVASPYPVESVLVTPDRLGSLAALLAAAGETAPVYVAPREVVAGTVGFDLHRGVVAVGRRLPPAEWPAVVAGQRAVVVVEGVNDHENLGAIFRNARALGAGAVLMDPTCADPLYRRSIRVSLGHALRLPFTRLAPWPAALAALRHSGFTVVALTPDPAAVPLAGPVPAGPVAAGPVAAGREATGRVAAGRVPAGPVAVLVGAEGDGLSAGARAEAALEVRIPMVAGVDSLNVATAAAIALHCLVGPVPAPA